MDFAEVSGTTLLFKYFPKECQMRGCVVQSNQIDFKLFRFRLISSDDRFATRALIWGGFI